MIGLRALFLRMVIEFFVILIDFGLLLLFMLYFKLGLFSVVYSYLISRVICECAHFCYLYRPAFIKKFGLFTRFAWTMTDRKFLTGFMSDSGFLVGRGVALISQYIVTPIVASRLGPNELAAYSVMISLFFYPNMISESMGTVCNIKGSQYIGLKKYSYFNRLVKYCPIVSLFVGFILIFIYGVAHSSLFYTFTSDPLVLAQMDKAFPYWMVAIFLGSLPGTFEGLIMSKQHFALMFMVMVASISLWIPITCINIAWIQELTLIFVATMVFMWTRFLPLMVIIYWEMYQERDWVDGTNPLDVDTKPEESPLIVNC